MSIPHCEVGHRTSPSHITMWISPLVPLDVIGRIPLIVKVQYSGYRDWEHGTTILATNTTYIVDPPPDSLTAVIYRDGCWGLEDVTLYAQHYDHHAFWLGYITIEHKRLRQPLHYSNREYLWIDGLRGDHTKSAVPRIIEEFTDVRRYLVDELKWVCQQVLQNRNLLNRDIEQLDLLIWLIHDALNAWGNLVQGAAGWTGFVLYFRAFQRTALEMDACIRWTYNVFNYSTLKSPKNCPGRTLRGFIFEIRDYDIFLTFARFKIPVYLINDEFPLPSPDIPKLPFPFFCNVIAGACDILVKYGESSSILLYTCIHILIYDLLQATNNLYPVNTTLHALR